MAEQSIENRVAENTPTDSMVPRVWDECSVGLFVVGQAGEVIHWNRWMSESTGIDVRSAAGCSLVELFEGYSGSPLQLAMEAGLERGEVTVLPRLPRLSVAAVHASGIAAEAEAGPDWMVIVKPMAEGGRRVLVQVFELPPAVPEVTGAEYAEREIYTRSILSSIADAVITTDGSGRINYMNIVAEKLTGWRLGEAMGLPLQKVFRVIGEAATALSESIAGCLGSGAPQRVEQKELVLAHRDGIGVAVEKSIAPIRDPERRVRGLVVVFRDISQERRLAAQVSWQASHDALTGLVNRGSFDRKLDELLQESRISGRIHCMLYLDLDQFKIVNDTCGHVAGDDLLRQIASTLASHVRSGDTLARLGGDEFGVLLAGCNEVVAQRIANEMRQAILDFRFTWDDKTYSIGVSIGVVTITAQSEGVESVLSAADAACYAAKDCGRNQVHLYQPHVGEAAQRQGEMRWVSRLHAALEEDRFRLYVQPIVPVESGSGKKGHHEVLIRMEDERGELVPPGDFIPAAERYGLMPKIDRWVVARVFSLVKREYPVLVERGCRFAINLSGASVNDEDTLLFIGEMMSEYRIPPGMICFEITETAAIANIASANYFIRTLKQAGCIFSLDDFGSGLSSFAYLKNLPVDYLKIDGAFVRDLADDPVDFAMVQAINQVGQVMGLRTVAEFVENRRILDRLRLIGVDFAQGYGIARPRPLLDAHGALLLDPDQQTYAVEPNPT
ncbi:MAG: EAL domain-containing protein [Sedimenticola sp.]|nr:EAL domain-containing protein [Sedimenticola sp.]